MSKKSHPDQTDMFHEPVFPSRMPTTTIECSGFSNRLARAMKRAAEESGVDRHELAFRMAQALDQDDFSKATLDAYISEAKTTHNISLVRFKAFVRSTGCPWLWDFAVADEGLTVLVGDEARLAEIARKEQERDAMNVEIKKLKATPVKIKRRQR